MAHRDQNRVRTALIPLLMGQTFSDEAGAITDCTLLNRAFLQGPDPLFLMLTCPSQFYQLCAQIGLTFEQGKTAIETAHVQGPGCLLDLTAFKAGSKMTTMAPQEALWLILASCSETVESEYTTDVSILSRFQAITLATNRLIRALTSLQKGERFWVEMAESILYRMADNTNFVTDDQKVPVGDNDIAFYLGYRAGERVVGCHIGDKVFYGTIPGITLADVGVVVETYVSPSYGFRRVG